MYSNNAYTLYPITNRPDNSPAAFIANYNDLPLKKIIIIFHGPRKHSERLNFNEAMWP